MEFLGSEISYTGISVSKSRTDAIQKISVPKTKKKLLSFLALCNYYRKLTWPNFAEITSDLYSMTWHDAKFEWNAKCQSDFEKVKDLLANSVTLAYPRPDPNLPFALSCDASGKHIGVVLQQENENNELLPIGFFSAKLTKHHVKWDARTRECYAIFAACQHFLYVLRGAKFKILCEHKALTNLNLILNYQLHGKISRWSVLFQELEYDVVKIAGKCPRHVPPDVLSRLETVNAATLMKVHDNVFPTNTEIRKVQGEDPF